MKCKLEIVTGFLGSGKTKFINCYIKTEVCKNGKILVILLEKGNNSLACNVDAIYLKDFNRLKDILLKNIERNYYDRIIIEVNGTIPLEKIGEIIKEKKIKNRINFYGNYFLGNCENLDMYIRNMGEFIIPYIQSSKLILLSNTNKIDKDRKKALIKTVEDINLTAPILLFDSIERFDEELFSNKYFKYTLIDKLINRYVKRG